MKIVKGILAVVAAIVVGSHVNFGILMLSNAVFGLPDGMNLFDAESVKANAHKLTMSNFAGTL